MAVEAKRGCGYRREGGLYLVGGGLSSPCDRMPYPLDRCRTCGGGVKFTRGHTWLQPDFFSVHKHCVDASSCPICSPDLDDFGPHLLLWIGRAHYTPEAYLKESRELGVSRRIPAISKGLVLGETWALLAHLDAVPAKGLCGHCNVAKELHSAGTAGQLSISGRVDTIPICDSFQAPKYPICTRCGLTSAMHVGHPDFIFKGDGPVSLAINGETHRPCENFQAPKPTPGIFCAFIPRAVELILKESDATAERLEKEAKRGVTVVTVPDGDKDHQGSVWDENNRQEELPGVSP